MNAKPTPKLQANHEVPFRLASLVATRAPEGCEGPWYRYVIKQGTNEITGVRNGVEAEVELQVRDLVDGLNDRRVGKTKPRGKTSLTVSKPAKT